MHWPKISEKKKAELEQLKSSIKTSPGKLHKKSSPKSIVNSDILQEKEDITSGLRNYNTHKANSDKETDKHSLTRKKIVWPENPLAPKPREKKEG
jgi:hypothetical protein